jgi:hypothetical protein
MGILQRILDVMFPEKFGKYITFRWVSVFVLLLAAWDVVFKLVMKIPPEMISRFQDQAQPFMRPGFLIPYNIGVAIGFYLIFASRNLEKYYRIRVIAYGMLLGAVCGQLIGAFVPFHT